MQHINRWLGRLTSHAEAAQKQEHKNFRHGLHLADSFAALFPACLPLLYLFISRELVVSSFSYQDYYCRITSLKLGTS